MTLQASSQVISNASIVKPASDLCFLTAHFPNFEVLYDETGNISSQDFVYMFSLLLYYSCVRRVIPFFQKCCENLDMNQQKLIFNFFATLKGSQDSKVPITKEVVRQAVKEATPSPPALKYLCASPLRTPDRSRTPNKISFVEKLKELQKVKTMLESERYERNVLEAEVKQNEDKIQSLVKEVRTLKSENHKLRTEQMLDKDQENLSPNKAIRDEQIRVKMQREIDYRDETIVNLKCEIERLSDENLKLAGKMGVMDREIKELRDKLSDFQAVIDELSAEADQSSRRIQDLENINSDLQSFISETRQNSGQNSSSDCLDFSFSTSNSGENLGQFVIDVQLKEKELEKCESQGVTAEDQRREGRFRKRSVQLERNDHHFAQ